MTTLERDVVVPWAATGWMGQMAVFPRSLVEFQRRFPTDEACGEYLVAVRWPRGFCCPACGHDRGWRLERRLPTFECAGCDRQTSATAGTVMHRSHLPLTTPPRPPGLGRCADGSAVC